MSPGEKPLFRINFRMATDALAVSGGSKPRTQNPFLAILSGLSAQDSAAAAQRTASPPSDGGKARREEGHSVRTPSPLTWITTASLGPEEKHAPIIDATNHRFYGCSFSGPFLKLSPPDRAPGRLGLQ